jgi:hypothetical protein
MPAQRKFAIAMGVLGMAIGMLPLLAAVGILPSRAPRPGDSPEWVGAAIGLLFFLGGLSAMIQGLAGTRDANGDLPATAPRALRVFYLLIGFVIVILLPALFSWVAFGPGTRSFSVSDGRPGAAAIPLGMSQGSQIMGRVAFGAGAIVMWLIAGTMILYMLRRRFPRR